VSAPSPLSPPARRVHLSALTEPVEQPALSAFISDSKAAGKPWRHITTGLPRPGVGDIIGQLIPVVIPFAGLLFLLYSGGSSLVEAVWGFTLEAPPRGHLRRRDRSDCRAPAAAPVAGREG
jgi:hypothetical protein